MSVPRPAGVPDPVRFCVLTTVALLAWLFGPPAVVIAMSLLGLWAYRRAMRAGLTESRCVLKRPWLVLAYLALALLGGVVGLAMSVRSALAQPAPELRGTVQDSTSRRPIAGAVVLLVNAADSVLARGISNGRGLYHVPLAPHAGWLQLRRIGYRGVAHHGADRRGAEARSEADGRSAPHPALIRRCLTCRATPTSTPACGPASPASASWRRWARRSPTCARAR